MKNLNMNRRTFLKVTTVASGGLLVGCTFQSNPNISTPTAISEDLGLFIRIARTIASPSSALRRKWAREPIPLMP
mgnify:CR=1 FL=1